jgi:cell division protein FtsL
MVLIFLSIIHIWQRVTVLTLANEAKKLNVKISKQQKEYKYLQLEVARLGSFEQIGVLPEAQDSALTGEHSWIDDIWIRLKRIKRNLLPVG